MCHNSVLPAGGLGAFSEVGFIAQVLAVTGRVAVGVAGQVNIASRIRADQVENLVAGSADGTEALRIGTLGVGVTVVCWLDSIEQVVADSEEACHEGPANDAAQVLAPEGLEGLEAGPVGVVVPGDRVAGHTVAD